MHLLHDTKMPRLWIKQFLEAWILLVVWSLSMGSNAARILDFPGSVTCLDDGVQIQKSKEIRLAKWKSLHVVDIAGAPVVGCNDVLDGKVANIPNGCMAYELASRLLNVAFKEPARRDVVYRIVCEDLQADDATEGSVVNCQADSMTVKFPRTLSAFDDEVVTAPQRYSWDISISDGTRFELVTVDQARQRGYILTSSPDYLHIKAYFNASGLQQYKFENQIVHVGAVRLSSRTGTPKIIVDVPMACVTGSPTCNDTYMTLVMPSFGGILDSLTIEGVEIPLNPYELEQNGIILEVLNNYLRLHFKTSHLKVEKGPDYNRYSLTSLILNYRLKDQLVPMRLTRTCLSQVSSPTMSSCTHDGFMRFEILEGFTQPKINLDSVIFGDGTCLPQRKSNRLVFNVLLNGCGTRKMIVDGRILYENEARALWKDSPRRISRDSELRITVRCYYSIIMNTPLSLQVVTIPPPVSSKSDGPLELALELFPDDSFGTAYSESQYPVVKTLRDPIYLEIRVLNRNDPNIELVLNDCWATMSRDPTAIPQWNVVVDGCQEEKDNFQTVFHPVVAVSLPTHRKRFEVKAFTFVTSGKASTNLIHFHCSAVICNTQAPDSPLCSTRCPLSKKKRDVLHASKDASVSLPGPILYTTPKMSVKTQDESGLLEHLAIGLLPVCVLTAVILVGLLVAHKNIPCMAQ